MSKTHVTISTVLLLAAGCCELLASDQQPRGAPVKIAVFCDKTKSTATTAVEQATLVRFDPLIQLLSDIGGELGFGFIREKSASPLVRYRVEPRPPKLPPGSHNVIAVAIAAPQLRKTEEERQRAEGLRLAAFRRTLEPLLLQPADSRRTDIFGALERADLFLAEPEPSWRAPARKYIVLLSDGRDNVHRPAVPLQSGARILLINGSASVGSLAPYGPVRLESLDAAIRLIQGESQ